MIQQVINYLYRYPKSNLTKIKEFGGFISYGSMLIGRDKMIKASERLPQVTSYPEGFPVYFLTGKKYIYQTLFCIRSLKLFNSENFKFILVDDGTFDDKLIRQVSLQLPSAEIILRQAIEENLEKFLPESRYPTLRRKRNEYAHIKKITDIHTITHDDWKLVLDSDMLFYAAAPEIVNWLKKPDKPLHMTDCEEAYGYSNTLMTKLASGTIPELVNVGAIGLNSEEINWDSLENWIKTLEQKEGKSYYLEQALTAMLLINTSCHVLNKALYIVNPTDENILKQKGILHHYVAYSKLAYFTVAWKNYLID